MTSEADDILKSIEQKLGGLPCNFSKFEAQVVCVGEDVTNLVTMFGKRIQVGSGLLQQDEKVFATQVGVLNFEPPNIFWVEHGYHRYFARDGDNVIGVVLDSFAENYKIDINSTSLAQLPVLAFDGASKRNRPDYKVGTLVYCRVAVVHKDMEPELSCMVTSGPKKDWMTGQSIYGELQGGQVFKCSLALAERLLDPECTVLQTLASTIAFEIAIGANGFVWVNAEKHLEITLIMNAIRKSENLNSEEIIHMTQQLIHQTFEQK